MTHSQKPILLLHSDAELRGKISSKLSEFGYRILPADTLEAAVQISINYNHLLQAILADTPLLAAEHYHRNAGSPTVAVLLGACKTDTETNLAQQLGIHRIVNNPRDMRSVEEAVERALEQYQHVTDLASRAK